MRLCIRLQTRIGGLYPPKSRRGSLPPGPYDLASQRNPVPEELASGRSQFLGTGQWTSVKPNLKGEESPEANLWEKSSICLQIGFRGKKQGLASPSAVKPNCGPDLTEKSGNRKKGFARVIRAKKEVKIWLHSLPLTTSFCLAGQAKV